MEKLTVAESEILTRLISDYTAKKKEELVKTKSVAESKKIIEDIKNAYGIFDKMINSI